MCAVVVLAVSVWRLITGFSTFQYHQPDSRDLVWDKTQNIVWSWRLRLTVTQARTCQDDKMNFCEEKSSIFYWQGLSVWPTINYWQQRDNARDDRDLGGPRRRRFPGAIFPLGWGDRTDFDGFVVQLERSVLLRPNHFSLTSGGLDGAQSNLSWVWSGRRFLRK